MFLAAGLVIVTLVGCHAKPYDYEPTAGEMKPGAGVFSGEDGELTIYDSKKAGVFPKDSNAEASETSAEKSEETSEAAGAAAAAAAGSQAAFLSGLPQDKAQDFQEFQQFQQWQIEKA